MDTNVGKLRLLMLSAPGFEAVIPWDTNSFEFEKCELSMASETVLRGRLAGRPFSALVLLSADKIDEEQCEVFRCKPGLHLLPLLRLDERTWCLCAPDGTDPRLVEFLFDLARERRLRPRPKQWLVLVADDVAVNRKLIGEYLERLDQKAVFANNGEEVLKLLQETSPDLILMDVEMPEMDGLQATFELRASKLSARNCPVVAVTGHSGAAERQRCLAAGMDDVLVKPVTRDALGELLERWAGKVVFHARPRLPGPEESVAPVALEQLERDVGYDRSLLGSLIESFVEDVEQSLHGIRKAFEEDDLYALRRWTQSIHGAASYFGARRLVRLAQSVELLGLDGTSKALLEELLGSFLQEWKLVKQALETAMVRSGGHEIELVEPLSLDPEQVNLVDLHSFLNMQNVIGAELLRVEEAVEQLSDFQGCLACLDDFSRSLKDPQAVRQALLDVPAVLEEFWVHFDRLRPKDDTEASMILESGRDNLRSIFEIMKFRAEALLARLAEPERWRAISLTDLLEETRKMLAAVEKNAKGRYQIVYNIAVQEAQDYLVHLDMKSVDGETVNMPAVFVDVLRDLIANARKYTDPGGTIQAGLSDDGVFLKIAVEDSGRGIPRAELANVVKFGYRAGNVQDRPTMGAGFGLTKAYWATKRFGGRMWIRSELERGTRVTIQLPSRSSKGPKPPKRESSHP